MLSEDDLYKLEQTQPLGFLLDTSNFELCNFLWFIHRQIQFRVGPEICR